MKLQRIVIEDYKRFTGRIVIDDLLPGLNVFTGPNEAGKSTLVEALRNVFLQRHKTSTLADLMPWGKPGSRPRVEVQYEIGGVDHLLVKHFVSRPHCELRIGAKRLEGDEAEEELARALGFGRAERGAAKPELGGIPGLLWVQQGASQNIQQSAQYAAQYLRDALGELAGGTIAQGDDVLIQAVRAEMTKLVTEKTRKPVGTFGEVDAKLTEAKELSTQLERQEQGFNADLALLTRLQAEFTLEANDRPWEELERRSANAVTQAQALHDAESLVAQTAESLAGAEVHAKLLNEQEQAAAADERAVALLNTQVVELGEQATVARGEVARARDAITALEAALRDATARRSKAEAAATYAELAAKLNAAGTAEFQLRKSVADAGLVAAALQALTLEATRLKVDTKGLKRLRQVDGELRLLHARRDAALTKVEYQLEPGRSVSLDGATLVGEGALSLDAAATLAIANVGQFIISPGVSDLAELDSKIASFTDELARLLQTLGVATLSEADERVRKFNSATADLATQNALLEVHAPDGVDALKTLLAEAVAKLDLARAKVPVERPDGDASTLADDKAAVELVLSQFEDARTREGTAINKRGNVEGQLTQAAASMLEKQALQQSPEYQAKRSATRTALADANAAVQSLTTKLSNARERVKELQGLVEVGAAERFRQSAQHARDSHQGKAQKLLQLRTQLEGAGANGLGEQIGQARARIEQMERRRQELANQAAALVLLFDTLVQERDQLVQQLRAPLTQRVDEYLRRLMPQSRLTVTDDLTPLTLVRDEGQSEFGSLSFGTQEQLGVVVRLAYADLLKDAGRPTLLIFDDAVTHSDLQRLERVKRALLHAAVRHQVFVLSCHPENWNDVGVPLRAIDEFKAA